MHGHYPGQSTKTLSVQVEGQCAIYHAKLCTVLWRRFGEETVRIAYPKAIMTAFPTFLAPGNAVLFVARPWPIVLFSRSIDSMHVRFADQSPGFVVL
jgi:hypothetical protein